MAPAGQKATAYGWYHLIASLMVLPGGLLAGLLWEQLGLDIALLTAAESRGVA